MVWLIYKSVADMFCTLSELVSESLFLLVDKFCLDFIISVLISYKKNTISL